MYVYLQTGKELLYDRDDKRRHPTCDVCKVRSVYNVTLWLSDITTMTNITRDK